MEIIINADDFGMDRRCSDAIVECLFEGIINTTTLMCNQPAFDYAVTKVKNTHYKNKIGIHLVLTEGVPLTDGIKQNKNFCQDGHFVKSVNRYRKLNKKDKEDVYYELKAQFEKFCNAGLIIHHVDSHHHIHTMLDIMPIVIELMQEFQVDKVRIYRNIGQIKGWKRIIKEILVKELKNKGYAYSDIFGNYTDMLSYVDSSGAEKAEIMCHPDYDNNGYLIDRKGFDKNGVPYGDLLKPLYDKLISKIS